MPDMPVQPRSSLTATLRRIVESDVTSCYGHGNGILNCPELPDQLPGKALRD